MGKNHRFNSVTRADIAEHDKTIHNSRWHSTFTFEQVEHLLTLAKENKVPNVRYSDDECSLWEMFHRHLYS